MTILNRPRISEEQQTQFKNDIKLFSRLLISELNTYSSAKYPTVATQNAFARKLGFDSFSEMVMLSVKESQCDDFSILNYFSESELLSIYSNLPHKGSQTAIVTMLHINNTIDEIKSRAEIPKYKTLDLSVLRHIINKSELSEHHYTENCGFPSEFKIEKTSDFFNELYHEDVFLVKDCKSKNHYTVCEFKDLYSNKKIFKILKGHWVNIDTSPFRIS